MENKSRFDESFVFTRGKEFSFDKFNKTIIGLNDGLELISYSDGDYSLMIDTERYNSATIPVIGRMIVVLCGGRFIEGYNIIEIDNQHIIDLYYRQNRKRG